MAGVVCVILGGGKGTRLYPLTKERSKPAVPFAGKYRLVDIPISNCINSNLRKIYVVTQFNSASLHNHISNTYVFDSFSNGFVELLAAEQRPSSTSWYQGTADAVRKNLIHFMGQDPDYIMILSGDQLYRMDLQDFLNKHIESGAEISIAAKPVHREEATGLGIIKADGDSIAESFFEKPAPDADIDYLKSEGLDPSKGEFLASMGIYIFNSSTLTEVLDNDLLDFGKEIIPHEINERRTHVYQFDGYWEDIGTIRSFYDCNLNMTTALPEFNFYDEKRPIYTHRRDLPPTKVETTSLQRSVLAEGGIVSHASIEDSLIGVRSIIGKNVQLRGVYVMGNSAYETDNDRAYNRAVGRPDLGIGDNTIIHKAIVDQNTRIGKNCSIGVQDIVRKDGDYDNYSIQDGIVIIPKGAIIPDNTII